MSTIFLRILTASGYFDDCDSEDDRLLIGELMSILITIVNVNTHPLFDTYSENQVNFTLLPLLVGHSKA